MMKGSRTGKYRQRWSQAHNTRYPYWALASHLRNTLHQRHNYYSPAKKQIQHNSYYRPAPPKSKSEQPRHHKIYPVFGKRSIPDAAIPHHRHRRSGVASVPDADLTNMEGIQIKYHRNSRQKLYERIEKYLDKRGHNGHQCVLRTLCETGQKSNEKEPGSFVGELLRAVFTIPEALDHEPVAYRDTRYDKAHAHKNDCAVLFPECKHSIWDAPFIQ
ncbi:GH24022 [Drosophila grimshawi]|uniref:GH24022 n=1 Tax=Drosophila grimshawi TaxID=7222 RepID=B4K1J4_DROGR|nr:GH24022 [Drosophila grimshawi]